MLDLAQLGDIAGVHPLKEKQAPAELVEKVRGERFDVAGFFLLENVERWHRWQSAGGLKSDRERWLFYGCPPEMIKEVLRPQRVAPYGSDVARPFGPDALYLTDRAAPAAAIALRDYTVDEALLISCRLAVGKAYRPQQMRPGAKAPPAGYDTIYARVGTDLGLGPLDHELFVAYDADRVLLRFATHIVRR
jgi:hypothetical protein